MNSKSNLLCSSFLLIITNDKLNQPPKRTMANIHNHWVTKIWLTLPLWNVGMVFLNLLPAVLGQIFFKRSWKKFRLIFKFWKRLFCYLLCNLCIMRKCKACFKYSEYFAVQSKYLGSVFQLNGVIMILP